MSLGATTMNDCASVSIQGIGVKGTCAWAMFYESAILLLTLGGWHDRKGLLVSTCPLKKC